MEPILPGHPANSSGAPLRQALDDVVRKMHTQGGAEAWEEHTLDEPTNPNWHPLADLREDAKEIVAYIDLPGMDEDTISIKLTGGRLVVSGERDFDHDTEDAEEFTQLQRPYGPFRVCLVMPPNAAADEMTAKYKRGVLKVRVPKWPHDSAKPLH